MPLARSRARPPRTLATLAAGLCTLVITCVAGPARADDEGESAEPQVDTVRDPALRFSPGQGLRIASDDERFSARLSVRAQLRARLQERQDGAFDFFATIPQARVLVNGHTFHQDIEYFLQLGLSPEDLGLEDAGDRFTPLVDLFFIFRWARELSLRVGQYGVPFSRDRLVSARELHMVTRSIFTDEMGTGRDLGADVYTPGVLDGRLRYYAGVYVGSSTQLGFEPVRGTTAVARVEVLPLGGFDDYSDGDLARSEDLRISIGAAYAYLDDAERVGSADPPEDGGTSDLHTATADLVARWNGFSVEAAVGWRDGERNPGEDPGPLDPVPAVVAGTGTLGWVLPDVDLELVTRAATVHPLAHSAVRERHELGAGLNWYIEGHPMKVQLDAFRTWTEQGWGDAQHRVRAQLQVTL